MGKRNAPTKRGGAVRQRPKMGTKMWRRDATRMRQARSRVRRRGTAELTCVGSVGERGTKM